MKIIPRRSKPCQTVAECHDWLPSHDVLRHALAAFHDATRCMERDFAQCVAEGGRPRPTRDEFADNLAELFKARLHDQGFRMGLPEFGSWGSECLGWWLTDTSPSAPARVAPEYVVGPAKPREPA